MYQRNVKLNFKFLILALLVVPFLAITVGTQTTTPPDAEGQSIKTMPDYQELRRRLGLRVIGAPQPEADAPINANAQNPTMRDLMELKRRTLKPEERVDNVETFTQQTVHPDGDNTLTIPHWSDSFTYRHFTYKYTMVGTDPSRGSATTTIPTVIVPMRFVFPFHFPDGTDPIVLDASTDLIGGQTQVQGVLNSPIFQYRNYDVGGVNVGNTQYIDAFQRANFWESVSERSPDYHVLLGQPTVAPTFEVIVPRKEFPLGVARDRDGQIWAVNLSKKFLHDAIVKALQQANVSPQTLAIVALGRVTWYVFPLSEGGFRGAYDVPGGVQTYIAAPYFPRVNDPLAPPGDVSVLSQELLNWLDDPFNESFTPGWDWPDRGDELIRECASNSCPINPLDRLDAGSVFAIFLNNSDVPVNTGSYTYHLSDGAFLDYFTRTTPSRSAGGQYSLFGKAKSPSPHCVGHVDVDMTFIKYPNAFFTNAFGINNNGWIVGSFWDGVSQNSVGPLNHNRGFVYDGSQYTQLDPPGSIWSEAHGINDAGQIVGRYVDAAQSLRGFSYYQGQFTTISFIGSDGVEAKGINNRGDMVGEYFYQGTQHGFVFQNGQYRTLDSPFALDNFLHGINDRGQIVGAASDALSYAPLKGFRFDRNGFTQYAPLRIPFTLNNRETEGGIMETGYVTIFEDPYAIWGPRISETQPNPAFVFGVNDGGQIVGTAAFGISPTNIQSVGYVAKLPTPSEDDAESSDDEKHLSPPTGAPSPNDFTIVAERNTPAPGGGPFLNDFEPGAVNASGDLAFVSDVNEGEALFVASRQGNVRQVVRGGAMAGGVQLGPFALDTVGINDNGDVGFCWLTGPLASPFGINGGLFRARANGATEAIMRPGITPAPGGGTFVGCFTATISNRADIAFTGLVQRADGPIERGVFVAPADGPIVRVAGVGDPAPGGGVFSFVLRPSIAPNGGDVAFMARIGSEPLGVYVSRGTSGKLEAIARPGDPALGGVIANTFRPSVNSRGDVLYGAEVQLGQVSLFLARKNAATETIMQPGYLLPDGVVFETALSWSLNETGDVAFVSEINTLNGVVTGLYASSHGQLRSIVSSGTMLPGIGQLSSLDVAPVGQVTTLIDGRGVVVFVAESNDRLLLLRAEPKAGAGP